MVDGRLPSPRAALTALWDWDGAALSGHHCVPLALRAVTCDQQCADSRRWGLGLCAPASEGMRKTRNTPGSTHQSPDRYPIDGPRANRAQGTRRAADERVATILLAPNFVRPTGSVENLPEQTTRDTRETAKRAKRSLEEGGATRKVRGAEKEYTGVLPGPADGVSARVARCDRRLWYQTPGLYVNPHFTPGASVDATPAAPEPVLPMRYGPSRTRYR